MKKIFLAFIIAALTVPVFGQNEKVKDTDQNIILAALKGWNVRLSAGYLIGGTAPLPYPSGQDTAASCTSTYILQAHGAIEFGWSWHQTKDFLYLLNQKCLRGIAVTSPCLGNRRFLW